MYMSTNKLLYLNYVGIQYKMNLEIKPKINVITPIIETYT